MTPETNAALSALKQIEEATARLNEVFLKLPMEDRLYPDVRAAMKNLLDAHGALLEASQREAPVDEGVSQHVGGEMEKLIFDGMEDAEHVTLPDGITIDLGFKRVAALKIARRLAERPSVTNVSREVVGLLTEISMLDDDGAEWTSSDIKTFANRAARLVDQLPTPAPGKAADEGGQ